MASRFPDRSLTQESATASQGDMKVCLDAATFVFHYKGSTIGAMVADREKFRAPG